MTLYKWLAPAKAGFFEPVEDFRYLIETVVRCANHEISGETCDG